jgi:hypothetical protein
MHGVNLNLNFQFRYVSKSGFLKRVFLQEVSK